MIYIWVLGLLGVIDVVLIDDVVDVLVVCDVVVLFGVIELVIDGGYDFWCFVIDLLE